MSVRLLIGIFISVLVCSGGSAIGADAVKGNAPVVPAAPEKHFITITTGGFFGVDYPVGSAICKMINEKSSEHHLYCSIRRSSGSIMNINRMRRKEANFAIVQSNIAKLAIEGSSRFDAPEPFTDLRGVLALYSQQAALISAKESGITSFLEFKGKALNIGPENSDTSIMFDYLSAAYGVKTEDFSKLTRVEENHLADNLCAKGMDGAVYVAGNPSPVIQRSVEFCGAHLISLESGVRDLILEHNPQLVATVIPAKTYKGQRADIRTVGLGSVLVTTKDTDPNIVTIVANTVAADLPTLRKAHPVMATLSRDDLLPQLSFLPVVEAAKAALR